jgi:hypothetical protein
VDGRRDVEILGSTGVTVLVDNATRQRVLRDATQATLLLARLGLAAHVAVDQRAVVHVRGVTTAHELYDVIDLRGPSEVPAAGQLTLGSSCIHLTEDNVARLVTPHEIEEYVEVELVRHESPEVEV